MSHLEVSPNVTLLKLDVLSAEDIAGAVEFVRIKTGGKLDYLVNNSGTGYTRPILDLDMKTAKYVFDVNVWAVVEITRAFVPLLIASKGSVVNISSVVAVTVTPYLGVYSASKAALTLLSETLRVELEPFGVSVITLMTGAVKSNQFANDPCPGLPDDSMYKPVEKQLESITDFDSFPRQTAAKYAKNVVSDVLGGETGKIWRGMGASVAWFGIPARASLGDRLPDFKKCVSVCVENNCAQGDSILPLNLRLTFWTCPSNCDYICQHVVTDRRLDRYPPMREPVVQYHGKWPFYRFLGMQEPFSVLFSAFNFLAHSRGLEQIRSSIPRDYPLRKYYILLGYLGLTSWTFSMIFHTRDYRLTERLDYFAAGASVLYGLYYAPIRVFRMDQRTPLKGTLLRLWTLLCLVLFICHVSYLTFWRWNYTYNMVANVIAGVLQNALWSYFSVTTYRKLKKPWVAWPGMIVAWVILAMSLELLDFPPIGRMIDAHSLWHLGTVGPTVWMYSFLVKDAQQDLAGQRLKA
ncbi:hypothetical protein MMC25_006342 [Agyrium rufum]|nr:hypothetical protein [Agyrium rufum]